MFNYLFHFLTGYVIIKIEGKGIENFLNLLNSEKIYIRRLKKRGTQFSTGEINPAYYHRVKLFSRECGLKISVFKRGGMPFALLRLKRRKAFCAGFFAAVFILLFLCSRIWVISIDETDPEKRARLEAALTENGIVCGMPRRELKPFEVQKSVLGSHDEYSWFWIEVKGTVATVSVRYRKKPPKITDTYDICNLIAKKDGIIEKITVRNGNAEVEKGTAVTKGQLLVSGVLPNDIMSAMYVHADADVIARVKRSSEKSVSLITTERIKTGKTEKKYSACIFGKNFNLFLKSPSFKHYDGNIREKRFKLFGNYYMPLVIRTYNYSEVKPAPSRTEPVVAEQKLKDELYGELKNTIGEKNILSAAYETKRSDNEVTVILNAECLENIGTEAEITFEKKPFVPKDISKSTITE